MKHLVIIFFFLFFGSFGLWGQTKPNASNTGYTGPITYVGGYINTSYDGQVIENKQYERINVNHNNVTIRNCLITSGGWDYGIYKANWSLSRTYIENCELTGATAAMIDVPTATITGCHFHDGGNDAIKARPNSIISGNFFEKMGTIAGKHADGVQVQIGSNITIEWNNFEMGITAQPGYLNSQCIIIQDDQGDVYDIFIRNNWIDGAGYSVQIRDKATHPGAPYDVYLQNNYFGTDYRYGPWKVDDGLAIISGNTYQDTGLLMPNQGASPLPNQVSDVQISPDVNAAFSSFTVAMSTDTSGASIYYTTDGSSPTTGSSAYSTPITVSADTTLTAFATASGWINSSFSQISYDVLPWQSNDLWKSAVLNARSEDFIFDVKVKPTAVDIDTVLGLGPKVAGTYADLGYIVQFQNGLVRARDGVGYDAEVDYYFSVGVEYLVEFDVDWDTETFDAYITSDPDGVPGTRTQIAAGYAVRNDQIGMDSVRYLSFYELLQDGMIIQAAGYDSGEVASGNILISGCVLDSDGETLTLSLSGGDGSYTPSTGVTGFTVRGSGIPVSIDSATISGNVVTLELASPLQGGEWVDVSLSLASNLSDSSGDHPTGQSAVKATNNSTVNNGYNRKLY